MDISDTLAPTSDQLDAVDLLGGPRTFTIERVDRGNAEQPINIHLAEFPRPWRPGKSMRRVLAACWGTDASAYAGRRVTLYCDPDVMFGKDRVGGTRISHLSHIDKPKWVPLLVSRGKSSTYLVEPLADTAPPSITVTDDLIDAATTTDELRAMWSAATPDQQTRIRARVDALRNPPATVEASTDAWPTEGGEQE